MERRLTSFQCHALAEKAMEFFSAVTNG